MCDIIVGFLNEGGFELKEDSFFALELGEIQSLERREWLRTHLSESAYYLLQGIIDQACSMESTLSAINPASVSVTGSVLLRTMLEYAYKLTHLTDSHISINQRIKRAIEIYHNDLNEYDRLPEELRGELGQDQSELLGQWYEEITGEELSRRIPVRNIFDSVGDSDEWPRDRGDNPINPVYIMGYQINSLIAHGNLWALRHYGLTHVQGPDGIAASLPGWSAGKVRNYQRAAASLLQFAFAFAMQLMHGYPPAHIMNRLNVPINRIY